MRVKEACTASVSNGFAKAAFSVGGLYAAISVYWALGGTRLLNTVSGSLGHEKGGARVAVLVAVWAAAALKLAVAVLPLRVGWGFPDSVRVQRWRLLTWLAAFILVAYGSVLTSIELLVQVGVIHASATADRRTLEWHCLLVGPVVPGVGAPPCRGAANVAVAPTSGSEGHRGPHVGLATCGTADGLTGPLAN